MRLIILGAGGYGKTIEDIAGQLNRYEEINFLDDKAEGENILGKIGDFITFINMDTEFYPAFGDNELRYNWITKLDEAGAKIATVVHPSAYISPKAVIEKGSAILPNASINYGAVITCACIVNMGAIVDHNVFLSNGVHVCPGAVVKGENLIPAFMKIESGTVIGRAQYPFD